MGDDGAPSFWWQQADRVERAALPGPTDADVCVVGAGYTGLWTAYYLARAAPDLRVVVLEQRFAGYGASGRNGGWLTNSITGGRDRYVRTHGAAAAHALQVALNDTVAEVLRVVEAEGIDAEVARGGELTVATNAAQWARLQAAVAAEQQWDDTGVVLLDAGRARERVAVPDLRGAAWQPHAARVHPARLVAGLARAAEARGVEIFEDTRVTALRPGGVETARGSITARRVVRATEGFTARLPGERRTWLPMNSSMIVTAPLPAGSWADIGWAGREVLGDAAHAYVYAQRTADDRIALGGRGVPYRFGSRLPDPARRAGSATATARPRPAPCGRCTQRCGGCSPLPETSRWSGRGRACWACRGTGRPRSGWTARRDWHGRAATSGPASQRRTWRAGHSPTCSSAGPPRSPRCRGWTTACAAGSPNRCAGSACAGSTRPTGRRTGPSTAADRRRRRSRIADTISGRH